ncbi:hypothetical protein KBC55_02535 [Patescibacteria group bacterium]|jgi:glycerol-3-phosphate dehydrogenase (NAD(P)+)|nr:hypothetical protein [Patescibacteria group bacterium]
MQITILGAGEIGSAIAHAIGNRAQVKIWDKNADKVPDQGTLISALHDADLVFLCIPSWMLRSALHNIKPHLPTKTAVVALTKGIERETCLFTDDLIAQELPDRAYGILGGPMLAEEIMSDKTAGGILGSQAAELHETIEQLFNGSSISIETTTDTRGVAVCGVLKNIYAVTLGICEGLALGDNAKGMIVAQAVSEMQSLAKRMGAEPQTAFGRAGLGDLFATGMSTHSRNHTVGVALANGGDGHLASEGLMSLPCVQKILGADVQHYPLLAALVAISLTGDNPKRRFDELFSIL